MTLSAMAPAEKSEHLIYASLPIAISLYIATLVTADPAGWMTVVGIISPVGTILLYELGLDELFVKGHYTRKLKGRSKSLRDFILSVNIVLKSWNTLLLKPPSIDEGEKYLDNEVDAFVEQAVSSYPVRKKLWRVRGTIYLGLSVLFLVPTGMILSTNYLNISFNQIEFLFWWLVFTLIINALIAASNYYVRYSNIVDHVLDLIQYYYMQVFIVEDSARVPREYANQDTIKHVMKSESAALDAALYRGDWSVFHQRWSRFCRTILNVAKRDFGTMFENIAFEKWGWFIANSKLKRNEETSIRQFSWFLIVSTWALELIKPENRDLSQLLKIKSEEQEELKSLLDANLILEFLPTTLMDQNEKEKRRTTAVGNSLMLAIRQKATGNFNEAVRLIIEMLLNDIESEISLERLAKVVMQYAKETHGMHERHTFPSGPGIERLRGVMKYIWNEPDAYFVVIAFLKVVNDKDFLKLLNDADYRKYLFLDPVWDDVQKVSRVMRQGKSNETRIKNIMKQLDNERTKFLKSVESG